MSNVYKKLNKLGSGTFGEAWLVKQKDTDRKYALKEIRVSGMSERDRLQSLVEVEALARCKHVNIVRYKKAFVDRGFLCIIMEYGDHGDLKRKIQDANGKHFAQNTILDWFVQMCYALKYIHGLNIIHRDLKTQNIFLTGDNVLKIGDFGIAKILQDSMDKASTAIGTPYYLSPEICHRHLYGTKSDIWAAGCVLYELCCLVPPFDGPDFSLLVVNIIRGLYSPIPKMYGPLLKDLVDVLLQVQPEKRPSARQVLSVAALQPYVTAHAHRMSRTSYQSPDGRSEPEIDKENVPAVGPNQKRRGSWSTPKKTPLVDCNRAVSSVDSMNQRIAPKTAKKGPTFSLYRTTLQKGTKLGKKSPPAAKKSPFKPKKVSIGKTYTIQQTSPVVIEQDGNEVSVDEVDAEDEYQTSEDENNSANETTTCDTTVIEVPSPANFHHEACRLLYNSCKAKSSTDVNKSMEALQRFLVAKVGAAEFVHAYERVRNALALGKDFTCIEEIAHDKFNDMFPLLIQLIQMQCCTML